MFMPKPYFPQILWNKYDLGHNAKLFSHENAFPTSFKTFASSNAFLLIVGRMK